MTRVVTLDLDDAEGVDRLWREYAQLRSLREVDPELRALLENLLQSMPADLAAEISQALDSASPSVVLAEYEDAFFEAKFGGNAITIQLAAFAHLRRQLPPFDHHAATLARIKAEPLELGLIVAEMMNYTVDLKLIVTAGLHLASEAGVEQDVAEKVISDAIRREKARVGNR